MPDPSRKHLTEAQQKAAAFLTRSKPDFKRWRAARESADIKTAEEKAAAQAKADAKRIANAKVGDVMPDGSIYAGLSPATNKRIFVAARDARVAMRFNTAAAFANALDAHGHKDWRVPTKEELDVLFQNREKGALKGTFNLNSVPDCYYLSSTPMVDDFVWIQRFSDGELGRNYPYRAVSVRCVRG